MSNLETTPVAANPVVAPAKRTRRTKAEMLAAQKEELMEKGFEEQDNAPTPTLEDIESPASLKIKDKYVYSEKTVEALEVAYATNKNVILFGPGGYSKSTLSYDFLLEKGHTPFVVTMGKGMTVDRLFGGLDLKKFQTDGKIEYLVENSFMDQEYVIFEELFDSPDYILEQLKDVLSSRQLRNGTQLFPLKTKFIICNTNMTRETFAKANSSLMALLERFPLELEVKWKDHNQVTYGNLLTKVKGFAHPMLTFILEEFAKAGKTISPRIALEAADILDACGPDCLEFIADFMTNKTLLKDSLNKYKSIEKLHVFGKQTKEYIDKVSTLTEAALDELTGKEIKELIAFHNDYRKGKDTLKKLTVDDDYVNQKSEVLKKADLAFANFSRILDVYQKKTGAPVNASGDEITDEKVINEAIDALEEIEL